MKQQREIVRTRLIDNAKKQGTVTHYRAVCWCCKGEKQCGCTTRRFPPPEAVCEICKGVGTYTWTATQTQQKLLHIGGPNALKTDVHQPGYTVFNLAVRNPKGPKTIAVWDKWLHE